MRRRLFWLCDSPSPYNAILFRALHAQPDIELLVLFRRPSSGAHPWLSDLREGYPSRDLALHLGIDWQVLVSALGFPRERRPDLLVVGGWNSIALNVLAAALILGGRRFAIWSDTPDLARRRPLVRSFARTAWLATLLERTPFVMGTGTPALEALRSMGARQESLVNFPYWVDVDAAGAAPGDTWNGSARADGRPFRILSVGRVENSSKGHDLVLRAMALLGWTDGRRFEYRIVGSGPDEPAVRALAESLGLGGVVHVLGWTEPDRVLAELRLADVFVHPSRRHEPYGVAVLEAMAAGLPVLASDVTCAALDRIEHGKNGLVHRADDARVLADDLAAVHGRPGLACELGRAARSTAVQWPVHRGVQTVRRLLELPDTA